MAKTGEDLREARAAGDEIDARIKALEAARPAPAPGGAARDVAVDVEAPAGGKFRLALTYRVAGARWTPGLRGPSDHRRQGRQAHARTCRGARS